MATADESHLNLVNFLAWGTVVVLFLALLYYAPRTIDIRVYPQLWSVIP